MFMRMMGIDYGAKRIGVALSDESGGFAFAHSVLKNCPKCLTLNVEQIKKICEENNIGKIILGESVDYKNQPNPIMAEAEEFKKKLEKETDLPIEYQKETLTTKEAEREQGKIEKIDASAAALILRSFLEQKK